MVYREKRLQIDLRGIRGGKFTVFEPFVLEQKFIQRDERVPAFTWEVTRIHVTNSLTFDVMETVEEITAMIHAAERERKS